MAFLVLFLLTLLNGFFALSEVALISVKKSRIEQLAEKGNTKAKIILDLLDKPQHFLSSIQVGITLIGIIAGAFGGISLTGDLTLYLDDLGFFGKYTDVVSLVLVIGSISYITIVIGELVPKSIGMNNAENIALICSPFIKYFTLIFFPFVKLLSFSTQLILTLFRVKENKSDHLNEDELKYLLLKAGKQGVLEIEESKIHQNLFYFTDQTAKSLMTPISKVEWLNFHAPINEIYELVSNSIHSKFLVSENTIQNLKGIITVKEFLENYKKPNFSIDQILVKPEIILFDTPAFKILNLFKKKKQYIGAVKDQNQKIIGIITLHDLIEAIIGRLPDEDEDELINIIPRADGTYLINGSTPIFEINQYFQKTIIKDNITYYTTLEGYIIKHLEQTPHTGVSLISGHYNFEIVDMDNNQIDKVILKKIIKEKNK